MAITISSNISSLNAQRNLGATTKALSANFGRLSSGMRINTASDDAAGLASSERMKAQISSMSQAERNSNDGISLLQTAEGAMSQDSGILIRMRDLAMQSANGTLGSGERDAAQSEFAELVSEIDRISAVTQFNGQNLLDGATNTSFTFQVGIGDTTDDQITATMQDMTSTGLGVNALAIGSATGSAGAVAALSAIDTAIASTSQARATLGATQNRLQVTVTNLQSARENLSAANSRIRDVDVAEESASMTRNNILAQAGVAVLAQANQLPAQALQLLRG